MKKTIGTLFLLTSAFSLANETPTISVTGTGTVSGKPDTFSIIATVETTNKNSQTAISENTDIINKAIGLLKKSGLKENNIKTENYSLNYRNDYNVKDGEMKYFVRNQILITSNDLDKAGTVLTALNNGGVNNIGEINFFIADRKELEDKAYKLAYENAKYKASLIAGIDDFKVSPKNIDLNYSMPRPISFMLNSAAKADDTPIPLTVPNDVDVTASMNVIFYMEK
ncbi:SIMPL domain-containing protein [Cetobacterium somerae]|uniref:SIMPL domain-containing protein n=1 Tax=Cetobacterium TaxID=180162 RepID=UPI001F05C07E|nr:SIMPL domain-containing protein [Cetobacterium somerae]MCX3067265.1 SIMPL domain-containing protein [Cetobacterium somerae]UPO97944.1 SIMPL domain-containing protein [Cetobacterium somerae]